MPKLDVLIYPDPLLRQKTAPISQFNQPDLDQLIADMFTTMDAYNGVGLAGPQIGVLSQILVVGFKKRRFVLINPKIVTAEGTTIATEGCLSLPNFSRDVLRYKKITVEAQDSQGNHITLKEKGYISRIIQHEMDHLNGILIIDHPDQAPEDSQEDQ